MPDKNVEVPGLGVVSFPDSMSDDQINSAIQAQLGTNQQKQPSTIQSVHSVPNARIRNLPNPAEGMSPGRALYEGAKTGLMAGSLPAAAASPVSAIRAIASGTAGSMVGQGVAKAAGAGEFGQEVAGDLSSLAVGGLTEGLFQSGKSALAGKLFTSDGELTELGKAIAHPGEKGGEYALRRMFGFDPDAQAGHEEFADRLAEIEKNRQKELSQFGRLKTLDEQRQAQEARLAAKNAPPVRTTPFQGMTSTAPAEVQTMPAKPLPSTELPGTPTLFKEFVNKFGKQEVAKAVANNEPLVMTPEEIAAFDQKQAIARKLASERGMQYAGGVRTAGPNKAANRLFPTGRENE